MNFSLSFQVKKIKITIIVIIRRWYSLYYCLHSWAKSPKKESEGVRVC